MFQLNKKEARLIILQRIELISNFLKRFEKFWKIFFSILLPRVFLSTILSWIKHILKICIKSLSQLIQLLIHNKNLLKYWWWLGGLELVINKKFNVKSFDFYRKKLCFKKSYIWMG